MILKTYSRIFTSNVDATLAVLCPLVGRGPELRLPFHDMEALTVGNFCILAGPEESIRPFLGAVGPVIVDDILATEAMVRNSGAEIIMPVSEAITGQMMFSKTTDGVVIEYVQWTPEIWEQVRAAERSAL